MPDLRALIDAGLTARQVDYWTRRGYLHPDTPSPGSGHWRNWSTAELTVGRRMARLVKAGLTPAAAHRVARGEAELAPASMCCSTRCAVVDEHTEPATWWCVGCGQPGRLDQTCPACGARAYTSTPPPRREVNRG